MLARETNGEPAADSGAVASDTPLRLVTAAIAPPLISALRENSFRVSCGSSILKHLHLKFAVCALTRRQVPYRAASGTRDFFVPRTLDLRQFADIPVSTESLDQQD